MHSMHSALAIKRQRNRQDMHSMGLHSALAIKRQRKRRDEQRRAKERRYSTQSTESGLGESQSSFVSPRSSMRGRSRRSHAAGGAEFPDHTKMMTPVGMLHIGVVFIVLGFFLLGSGLLPDDITNWSNFTSQNLLNELTISGACAVLLGIFLIILNRIISKKEEDDLAEYVQRQLTRSRSGHRLVRDEETGALTTRAGHRARKDTESSRTNVDTFESINELEAVGNAGVPSSSSLSPVGSPSSRSPPHNHNHNRSPSPPHHLLHTDLEKILEEDVSEKGEEDSRHMERYNKEAPSGASSMSPGMSPGSPSETRQLLTGRIYQQHHHMVAI